MMRFIFLTLAFGYLASLCLLFLLQRQLVFPAARFTGTPAENDFPEYAEIRVPTPDGLHLRAWFVKPRLGRPVIIHFHGNGSSIASRARTARLQLKAGYGVLLAGYRGYSGNAGQPSEQGLYVDARAQLDWLKGQGFDRFVLQGESLGTGIAVQMATEFSVQALILESPYTRLTDVAARHYPYMPIRLLMKDKFDSIDKIRKIRAPLLVVMSELDSIVPVAQGRKLYAAANDPKQAVWLTTGAHNLLYDFGAAETVMSFLDGLFDAPVLTAP